MLSLGFMLCEHYYFLIFSRLASDGIPLFGYRRRSYLVLCGLLGAVAWIIMAMLVEDKYSAAFAILLSSLSVAFSDVVSL